MKYLCVAMAAFLLVACESNELYPAPAVENNGKSPNEGMGQKWVAIDMT